ncbi:hypothetical protein C8R44DRAFT_633095 [Mycena epipterygia]|nr:hypothetical protein C8R44DRAFT_633095 [Mycena epipterygia]
MFNIREVPPIMILDINHPKINFSEVVVFDCTGVLVKMYLRGIIYGGQGHFTCRFFEMSGTMWFHDGITTGAHCRMEGTLKDVADLHLLHRCGEKLAVAMVYAKNVCGR